MLWELLLQMLFQPRHYLFQAQDAGHAVATQSSGYLQAYLIMSLDPRAFLSPYLLVLKLQSTS